MYQIIYSYTNGGYEFKYYSAIIYPSKEIAKLDAMPMWSAIMEDGDTLNNIEYRKLFLSER